MTATLKTTVIREPSSSIANITLDSSGNVVAGGSISDATGVIKPIISGTAITSTSGTVIDFGSVIPSWAKRVTVIFSGISINLSGTFIVQLGTSAGYQTSGYISTAGSSNATSGFIVLNSPSSTDLLSGSMQLFNITGNSWVASVTGKSSTSSNFSGGGDVTLSGTLDRLRVTTVAGTSTFDAGTINIFWEG